MHARKPSTRLSKTYSSFFLPCLVLVGNLSLVVSHHIGGEVLSAVNLTVTSALSVNESLVPSLSKNSVVTVRFPGKCNCPSFPSRQTITLAGQWHGERSVSGGYLEMTSSGFVKQYKKKPWKLWRQLYRYGRELRQLVCGQGTKR